MAGYWANNFWATHFWASSPGNYWAGTAGGAVPQLFSITVYQRNRNLI